MSNLIAMETPNLDGLDLSELDKFRGEVEVKIGALGILERYAATKAFAMGERLAGRIASALDAEATCESLFGLLPDEFKW